MPFPSALLMDLAKQIEEKLRKAPAMWEVGGTAKFRTRVLAPGRGWAPLWPVGMAGHLLPAVWQLEEGTEYMGNMGAQPELH